jgi:predicted TIM-barrel fold metal-dependent hydrolase
VGQRLFADDVGINAREDKMIIDAHAHIMPEVNGQTGSGLTRSQSYGMISWGEQTVRLLPPMTGKTSFPPEVLLENMDWAGVDKAVLLQGPFYGELNDYVAQAVKQWPDRFIGAAYLDPWMPDAANLFETIITSGGFRAVKLECSEATGLCGLHPDARLDALELNWLWQALEQRGVVLTFDLGAVGSRSYQTEAVRMIAETYPRLKIVIAHLGQPTPQAEADPALWTQWQAQIELGQLPNVWFDSAALIAYLPHEEYPYPTAARYLRLAVERIGADRIMWGSDQPGTLTHLTYRQYVALANKHLEFLSSREQSLVLSENALQVYG